MAYHTQQFASNHREQTPSAQHSRDFALVGLILDLSEFERSASQPLPPAKVPASHRKWDVFQIHHCRPICGLEALNTSGAPGEASAEHSSVSRIREPSEIDDRRPPGAEQYGQPGALATPENAPETAAWRSSPILRLRQRSGPRTKSGTRQFR